MLLQRSYSAGSSPADEGIEMTEFHSQQHHNSRLADQSSANAMNLDNNAQTMNSSPQLAPRPDGGHWVARQGDRPGSSEGVQPRTRSGCKRLPILSGNSSAAAGGNMRRSASAGDLPPPKMQRRRSSGCGAVAGDGDWGDELRVGWQPLVVQP